MRHSSHRLPLGKQFLPPRHFLHVDALRPEHLVAGGDVVTVRTGALGEPQGRQSPHVWRFQFEQESPE